MLFSVDRYVATLRFTATRHLGQVVTDSQLPYIVHVTSVAAEVIAAIAVEPVDDPDLAIGCALLHDTIEDTATTYDEVVEHFGARVADGVLALSKVDESIPKPERMADSLRRILLQPPEIALVKLGDRTTNLAPPPSKWSTEKRRAYHAEAQLIAAQLAGVSALLDKRIAERIALYPSYF
jgi:(p)ppGpp synthase/HD superfamily hydrolase